MKRFKEGKFKVLVATDVAARGLDLPNISDIIQYDPPADINDYIHRIGRAGRMGKSGKSFLFLLPSEQEYTNILSSYGLSVLEHNILPFLQNLDKDQNFEAAANNLQSKLENFILSNSKSSNWFDYRDSQEKLYFFHERTLLIYRRYCQM